MLLIVSYYKVNKHLVGSIEESKKKEQPVNQQNRKGGHNESEDKLQQVDEKGEDAEDVNLGVKDLQKKAQEFVKENYDKFIKKKQPKAKQNN